MARSQARLYLSDDGGNYYVLVAGAKEPILIPDDQKSEVEAALEDEDEKVGALALGVFDLAPVVRIERELTTLGACRGTCGQNFGVLRDSDAARLYLQDDAGNLFVQAEGMKQPVRVPDSGREVADAIVAGNDDKAGFSKLPAFAQRSSVELKTLGACRGTCGRTFGVLQEQEA